MSTIYAFPPLIGENPRILILGTMPGAQSLKEGQYYAHPQNQFWRLMGEVFGGSPALPYQERVGHIISKGIAVWDVLQSCERNGSLDSAIKNALPHDFPLFFNNHQTIKHVVFDSLTAEKIFYKQNYNLPPYIQFHRVPSPSPAYAFLRYEEKLKRWKQVLQNLNSV